MDQAGAMTPMPQYQSHKKVWAIKISSVENIATDKTADENQIVFIRFEGNQFSPREFNLRGKPTPEAGWYFVQYEGGYESFSPEKAFEEGHTLIANGPLQVGMKVNFNPASNKPMPSPREIIGIERHNEMIFYVLAGLEGSLFLASSLVAE